MRYTRDPEVDLTRKLDLPTDQDYRRDLSGLQEVLDGEVTDSQEAYQALGFNTYHELFADRRLKHDDTLKVDEEQVEEMRALLEENRPGNRAAPLQNIYELGYSNPGRTTVEDPVTGGEVLKEDFRVAEDPFSDSEYVLNGHSTAVEWLPIAGEFFKGREEYSSDRFYTIAGPRVKREIGEVYLELT